MITSMQLAVCGYKISILLSVAMYGLLLMTSVTIAAQIVHVHICVLSKVARDFSFKVTKCFSLML